MKKYISLILLLVLLSACAAKETDFYQLTFKDKKITVGFDDEEKLKDIKGIYDYQIIQNKKKQNIISSLTIYVNDLQDKEILINNYSINNGVKNVCEHLNGEFINNNGYACVLHQEVKKKENVVIIYGNILNDDMDKIDHLEISYK